METIPDVPGWKDLTTSLVINSLRTIYHHHHHHHHHHHQCNSQNFLTLKNVYLENHCTRKTYLLSLKIPFSKQNTCHFFTLKENQLYSVSKHNIASAIRQKGESQNGCYKKTKHVKFSEKGTFLTPWYTHALLHYFRFSQCPQIMWIKCLKCTIMLQEISETFT